jgi:hypothetical protein
MWNERHWNISETKKGNVYLRRQLKEVHYFQIPAWTTLKLLQSSIRWTLKNEQWTHI